MTGRHPASGTPPGIDATRPVRRGLLIPALAFGCAMLLLLGVGGGLGALWLSQRESPTPSASSDATSPSSPAAEPGIWHPLDAGETPTGTAEDLTQVLTENPLMDAQLEDPVHCAMPETDGGKVPAEELPGYLATGGYCLAEAWSAALAAQGIAFEPPTIVVFTTDALPEDTACVAGRFSDSAPVVCHDDNTLYWPERWDPGFSHTSAEETPQLYMWHLSYSYTMFVLAAVSLDGYYGALQLELADRSAQADEAQRRWALQISCLASAATFRMPEGVRPSGRVEEFVISDEAQAAPAGPGEPSSSARAAWVRAGRDGAGSLGSCRTWSAPADVVS